MLAASGLNWISGLGWLGILCLPVVFVGYLVAAHAFARWTMGSAVSGGGRLATGLVVAGVVLGAGAALRAAVVGPDGAVPGWLRQVLWGGGTGLAFGVGAMVQSVRRPSPRSGANVPAPPAPSPETPTVAARHRVAVFHATLFGLVAVGFIGCGIAFVVLAVTSAGSLMVGLFGGLAILIGLALARLAWGVARRGRRAAPTRARRPGSMPGGPLPG